MTMMLLDLLVSWSPPQAPMLVDSSGLMVVVADGMAISCPASRQESPLMVDHSTISAQGKVVNSGILVSLLTDVFSDTGFTPSRTSCIPSFQPGGFFCSFCC